MMLRGALRQGLRGSFTHAGSKQSKGMMRSPIARCFSSITSRGEEGRGRYAGMGTFLLSGLVLGATGAGLLVLQDQPPTSLAAASASYGKTRSGPKKDNTSSSSIKDKEEEEKKHDHPSVYDINIISKEYPEVVPVFIEVSRGSRMKYEWDSDLGLLKLDRVLSSAVFYPFDYGFVPQTLCEDGDPLDVLVMGDNPLEPGCIVEARVIAYLVMEDEKGKDEKVLAVLTKDPRLAEVRTMRDLSAHSLREVAHFFQEYKVLEREKWVRVGGWKGTQDTIELVEATHQKYKAKKAVEAANAKSKGA